MKKEEWKAVDGYPGYEVSNLGRIKSLDRLVRRNANSKRISKGQMLKPWRLYTGYMQVKFHRKAHSVHRLVAIAFCPGWFDGAVVNHTNGIRHDNRAENLEWVTHSYNQRHSYSHLGRVGSSKGFFSSEHPTSKSVIATSMKTGESVFYGAAMDAVRAGFRSDSISRCCNKKIAHHKGFYWRFATDSEIEAFGAELGVMFGVRE